MASFVSYLPNTRLRNNYNNLGDNWIILKNLNARFDYENADKYSKN
jgi:hypothetical protein